MGPAQSAILLKIINIIIAKNCVLYTVFEHSQVEMQVFLAFFCMNVHVCVYVCVCASVCVCVCVCLYVCMYV